MRLSKKFFTIVTLCCIGYISSEDSCFQPFCSCDIDNQILNCLTFNSFTQLDFTSNLIAWKEISFFSFTRLKLDSNLNLQGLKLNTSVVPKITISNIEAFNIDYNPFKKIEYIGTGNKIDLIISNSRILFESTSLNFCTYASDRDFIFSGLKLAKLGLYFDDFLSSSRFCPLMFHNSTIDTIEFLRPSGNINFVPIEATANPSIKISELIITGGYDSFPKSLTQASILNYDLFKSIKALELQGTYISTIENNLLEKFQYLKNFKFNNIRISNLLSDKTLTWFENLNSNQNINLDTTALTQDVVTNKVARLYLSAEQNFEFEDEDFCLLDRFPHKNLVLPLIDKPLLVPCSCTIYFLYKYYQQYKPYLTNDELRMIPTQCLDINTILLQEQLDYCDIDRLLAKCKGETNTVTTGTTIQTGTTGKEKTCINPEYKCECNFDYFNYLSCSNPLIVQVPTDFTTSDSIQWNFVSFVGSSITTISDFNSLELAPNAVVTVKNINNFGSRIFSKLLSTTSFQFIVEQSSLFSLGRNLVFFDAKLSLLEFNDCEFSSSIVVNCFEGATIDTLLIKYPKNLSSPFEFRPQPLFKPANIRKFKIENAYDSFTTFFTLDSFTLPNRLFQSLEELEVVNTQLFSIDDFALEQLDNLKILKLNNINLIQVLKNSQLTQTNWLSTAHVEKLFLGREYETGFYFQDTYLCDFKAINSDTMVYIYDSIDSAEGPDCTCTIFWLYKNIDYEALKNDVNSMYVPKCIKNLGNSESLNDKISNCLNNVDIETYCNLITTTTDSTASVTSVKTTQEPKPNGTSVETTSVSKPNANETVITKPTTTKTIENDSIKVEVAFYGFIILAVLFVIVLGLLIVLFYKLSKFKSLNKLRRYPVAENTTNL